MWMLLVACALILFILFWDPGDREIRHSEKAPGSDLETGAALQKPAEGSSDAAKRRTFLVRFVPVFSIVFTTATLGAFTLSIKLKLDKREIVFERISASNSQRAREPFPR